MILRVGLTGGIASGKSTVARMLHERGCWVVDADQIVRELYRPGAAGHRALLERYGHEVADAGGEIDRPRLSALALSTAEGARELNALIHPLVIAEQDRLLESLEAEGRDRIAVVEATLLIESGGRVRFDRIVVVDVSPEVQIGRGVARGLAEEELRRRIARQMSREERLSHADYVVLNDQDEAALTEEVDRLHATLVRDLATKRSPR